MSCFFTLTTKAIIKIAQHYDRVQIIYHAYHNKPILLKDFIKALKSTGIKIKPVSTKHFREELDKAASNPKTAHIFEAFVNDISTDGDFRLQSKIELCNAHTTRYLERAGFVWQDVDERYLREYVEYFRGVVWFGG